MKSIVIIAMEGLKLNNPWREAAEVINQRNREHWDRDYGDRDGEGRGGGEGTYAKGEGK